MIQASNSCSRPPHHASIEVAASLEGLDATLTTQRLILRSTCRADRDEIVSLYADPEVMARFAEGTPRSGERMTEAVNHWSKRWASGDPFSAFSVFQRQGGAFVGVVVMGHGDAPGQAELAVLSHRRYWGQGFGREACQAVVCDWAPETVRRGYRLEGALLGCVVGTARLDNPASAALMRGIGMERSGTVNKWGKTRETYRCSVTAAAHLGACVGKYPCM